MATIAPDSQFQKVVEAVEALPAEDQAVLLDIIDRRLSEAGRQRIVREVRESRAAYLEGSVARGSADDLLREITS